MVVASFAVVIDGENMKPNVSLSNHTHTDMLCPLAVMTVHASLPPKDPAGDTSAVPGYLCLKLASDVAGSASVSLPPTNMNICVLPLCAADEAPCSYTPDCGLLACPPLCATIDCEN